MPRLSKELEAYQEAKRDADAAQARVARAALALAERVSTGRRNAAEPEAPAEPAQEETPRRGRRTKH